MVFHPSAWEMDAPDERTVLVYKRRELFRYPVMILYSVVMLTAAMKTTRTSRAPDASSSCSLFEEEALSPYNASHSSFVVAIGCLTFFS